MTRQISLEDALRKKDVVFLDVRSPKEFNEATIPNAINLPLFDDEERAIVGTMYHQLGEHYARVKGLEIASSKLPAIIDQVKKISNGKEVVVFCWRGGMRSKALVTVLDLMGINSYQLIGGYRAYRKYLLDWLNSIPIKAKFVVLHGLTGVGKTKILHALADLGVPVLDLERMANNRGSIFGNVGLGSAPTQKRFDTMLMTELLKFTDQPFLLVECESKRIGNLYLPERFMEKMKEGLHILATASLETRIRRLVEEYVQQYSETTQVQLAESISVLERRLGKMKTEYLLKMLANSNYEEVARVLLLDYYDPLYGYDENRYESFDLVVDTENIKVAAEEIKTFLNNSKGKNGSNARY